MAASTATVSPARARARCPRALFSVDLKVHVLHFISHLQG